MLFVAPVAKSAGAELDKPTSGVEIYLDGERNNGAAADSSASQAAEATSEPQTPTRVYCVRTCDGYYFPLDLPREASLRSDAQAACHRGCQGTETVPYFQTSNVATIEGAKSLDMEDYGALKTAYSYKSKLKSACGCARSTNLRDSILTDPTLRKGDIVVTSQGLVMFQGFENTNMLERNFSSIKSARLPAQFEAELQTLDGMYQGQRDQGAPLKIVERGEKARESSIYLVEKPEPNGQ